ncbi:hypothetical protein [Epibacterium ulvae]|uniref:hypothetical protein n=1 Tax=Epibacterium ulvae TaxID=1156985 RepID=UPI0024921D7C|nr:hypothetical protein [Epibacterium ulvae]
MPSTPNIGEIASSSRPSAEFDAKPSAPSRNNTAQNSAKPDSSSAASAPKEWSTMLSSACEDNTRTEVKVPKLRETANTDEIPEAWMRNNSEIEANAKRHKATAQKVMVAIKGTPEQKYHDPDPKRGFPEQERLHRGRPFPANRDFFQKPQYDPDSEGKSKAEVLKQNKRSANNAHWDIEKMQQTFKMELERKYPNITPLLRSGRGGEDPGKSMRRLEAMRTLAIEDSQNFSVKREERNIDASDKMFKKGNYSETPLTDQEKAQKEVADKAKLAAAKYNGMRGATCDAQTALAFLEFKKDDPEAKLEVFDLRKGSRRFVSVPDENGAMKTRVFNGERVTTPITGSVFDLNGGPQHRFLVINRDTGTDESDPRTWNPDAVILDAFAERIYQVPEIMSEVDLLARFSGGEFRTQLAYDDNDVAELTDVIASEEDKLQTSAEEAKKAAAEAEQAPQRTRKRDKFAKMFGMNRH